MFRIFIFDPTNFLAVTGDLANGNAAIPGLIADTQLYLFDANGVGVMGNDDDGPILQQSRLYNNGSLAAGIYYLLITGWDLDPLSAGGLIFPTGGDGNNNFLQGPTGPGGQQALIGYSGDGTTNTGEYQITLVGAMGDVADVPTPEPGTLALAGVAMTAVALVRRKKN